MKNANVDKIKEFCAALSHQGVSPRRPLTLVLKYGPEPWAQVALEGAQLFAVIAGIRMHEPSALIDKLKEVAEAHRRAMQDYFHELEQAKRAISPPDDGL